MVSKQALTEFLDKKVFVKIIDEQRVQVGTLVQKDEDFFIESPYNLTAIDPGQIARITLERGG